jgi:hypothetical protein
MNATPPPIPLLLAAGLLLGAGPLPASEAAPSMPEHLAYVVSYQGLLSAGIRLQIAAAHLQLTTPRPDGEPPLPRALLAVSTRGYDAAELLMPIRYCYRARLKDPEGATIESEWRSRVGAKASWGRLHIDRDNRRVLRLHVERKLASGGSGGGSDVPGLARAAGADEQDRDRDEATFLGGAAPMDQLGLVYWLRRQSLATGDVLEPAVSDGRHLQGYRVTVEGEEDLAWDDGQTLPSYRLRLEPRVDDDREARPMWLWLSRDARRLPLLLKGYRGLGSFEARLVAAAPAEVPDCAVPETAGLVLPDP